MNLFKEGVFIDTWTVSHLLFGVLCFLVFYTRIKSIKIISTLTLVLAVFWEFFEIKVNVEEFFSNRVVDVLSTLLAFYLVYYFVKKNNIEHDQKKYKTIFYCVLGVYFLVNLLGWLSYIFL